MSQRPLEGIRIADLTRAAAGPYGTLLLGALGAEVIKVETASKLSLDRQGSAAVPVPPMTPDVNATKKSITLNLKHPRGLELVQRLIAVSDALVENFRPGVMDRLGLGYPVVRKLNPRLVVLSMSAYGASGPDSLGPGYAPIFAALAGASHLTGYPDGPPVELRLPIDLACGTMAAVALLGALYQARTTGQGQWIEVANRDVASSFVGEYLLDAYFNHRDARRQGNRDDIMAPHNVYPCRGQNQWVSIAVGNDQEWQALCHVVGHREWLEDPRFSDQYLRWRHQEELDPPLAAWTQERTPWQVSELLQGAGVAAAPCVSSPDLLADPHLEARDALEEVPMPDGRPWRVLGAPWKLSRTPTPLSPGAPSLGQHNQETLCGLLGLPLQDLQDLIAEGVVG